MEETFLEAPVIGQCATRWFVSETDVGNCTTAQLSGTVSAGRSSVRDEGAAGSPLIPSPVVARTHSSRTVVGTECATEVDRVGLHVYDLTDGFILRHKQHFLADVSEPERDSLSGIHHSGLVAFGCEFYFEGGVARAAVGATRFGTKYTNVPMGRTRKTREQFEHWLRVEEQHQFQMAHYHPTQHNCHHFTHCAVTFLLGSADNFPPYLLGNLNIITERSSCGRLLTPFMVRYTGGVQRAVLDQMLHHDSVRHDTSRIHGVLVHTCTHRDDDFDSTPQPYATYRCCHAALGTPPPSSSPSSVDVVRGVPKCVVLFTATPQRLEASVGALATLLMQSDRVIGTALPSFWTEEDLNSIHAIAGVLGRSHMKRTAAHHSSRRHRRESSTITTTTDASSCIAGDGEVTMMLKEDTASGSIASPLQPDASSSYRSTSMCSARPESLALFDLKDDSSSHAVMPAVASTHHDAHHRHATNTHRHHHYTHDPRLEVRDIRRMVVVLEILVSSVPFRYWGGMPDPVQHDAPRPEATQSCNPFPCRSRNGLGASAPLCRGSASLLEAWRALSSDKDMLLYMAHNKTLNDALLRAAYHFPELDDVDGCGCVGQVLYLQLLANYFSSPYGAAVLVDSRRVHQIVTVCGVALAAAHTGVSRTPCSLDLDAAHSALLISELGATVLHNMCTALVTLTKTSLDREIKHHGETHVAHRILTILLYFISNPTCTERDSSTLAAQQHHPRYATLVAVVEAQRAHDEQVRHLLLTALLHLGSSSAEVIAWMEDHELLPRGGLSSLSGHCETDATRTLLRMVSMLPDFCADCNSDGDEDERAAPATPVTPCLVRKNEPAAATGPPEHQQEHEPFDGINGERRAGNHDAGGWERNSFDDDDSGSSSLSSCTATDLEEDEEASLTDNEPKSHNNHNSSN